MSGPRRDVVGIGYAAVDHLLRVASFPEPGRKQEMTGYLRQGGGQTATALAALARWGRSVAAVCAVGDDDGGRFAIEQLADDSVDTAAMVVRPGVDSLTSFILVDERGGERTIVYRRDPALTLVAGDADLDALLGGEAPPRCLFLDGHEPLALDAARAARARGVPVVLDSERIRPFTGELLALCTVVLCDARFPGRFTGRGELREALEVLAGYGPGAGGPTLVGATRGQDGVLAWARSPDGGGRWIEVPAVPTDAVDTTGAGDVFHAGFVHAWLDGHAPERCLAFGAAAAALKCEGPGGRSAIPRDDAVIWARLAGGG